jgi:hypothetical protein
MFVVRFIQITRIHFEGTMQSSMIVQQLVDCVWNVLAHAQKPDFVFRQNGRVHLNRRGLQFCRLLGSRCVRISGSNAGYTTFRGSVKSTGYPFHSPFSLSLPLPTSPCVVRSQTHSALYACVYQRAGDSVYIRKYCLSAWILLQLFSFSGECLFSGCGEVRVPRECLTYTFCVFRTSIKPGCSKGLFICRDNLTDCLLMPIHT